MNAISKPKNKPPTALNPSPLISPLWKKLMKSKPLPTRINEPITQTSPETMLYHVGFSLMKRNMNNGMVIHEIFSKNVFLEGTVYLRPTNWKMYAKARKIPAGIQIK